MTSDLIYVASPYSSPDPMMKEARYKTVLEFTAFYMAGGAQMLSPIVYGHEMSVRHDLPGDARYWERFNYNLFKACGSVIVLCIPAWGRSQGVAMEIKWAKEAGVQVMYDHDPRWTRVCFDHYNTLNGEIPF